jgi:hypothetical protein
MINMQEQRELNDHLFKITAGVDPELHHALDPMDVDNGPFQELAWRSAEPTHETARTAV